MSGHADVRVPSACIDLPLGVKYLAVVSFTALVSVIGMIVCTDPFPSICSHYIDLSWSCSAPARISEAEADPSFTNVTIGRPESMSPGLPVRFLDSSRRPKV